MKRNTLTQAYVNALAGGVAAALLKRRANRQIARPKKKSKTIGVFKRSRRNRTVRRTNIGMPSVTLTKRNKTFKENHSLENRATSLQVGAKRPSAMTYINAILEPQWFRCQGLSQYDTSTGFYPIANRLDPSGAVILPCHVWDLTACQNYNGAITNIPNVGHVMYYDTALATANAGTFSLSGQDEGGNLNVTNCPLLKENVSGNTIASFPTRKAFHHYSHIKMNLYGVRKRATRFKVDLVMVKEEYADFLDASNTNVEKKKLFDYLSRPFMYTNLNSGDPQAASDIKILKSYEVIIPPSTLDEYGGQNAVPHIQTLNWFINHNRLRRYDWKSGPVPDHGQNAAFDLELATDYQTRTDNKYRVYMLVRALCPERRILTVSNNDAPADPISEPSYDCVIRQKFSFPI